MSDQVRIRSASDLFGVLTTGSYLHQAAVLQSVAEKPERALQLGRHDGEDFIDLLIRLIPHRDGGVKKLMVMCVSFYQDPRTTVFLLEEFARSRDAATVLHLGRRLCMEKEADFFRQYLWLDDYPAQSLVAARLLRESAELSPAERLRIAIFLNEEFEPPALCARHLGLWQVELCGPHRRKVRQLAEAQGRAVLLFWDHWERLAEEEKEWLAELTIRLEPEQARERLASLLTGPSISHGVVAQAVGLNLELPLKLLESDDERVRAAVIAQGSLDQELDRFLSPQATVTESIAAARRCSTEKLVELLGHERWQVRAAATQALVGSEDCPIESVRERAMSSHQGEKLAAVEILLSKDDDIWLMENLASFH